MVKNTVDYKKLDYAKKGHLIQIGFFDDQIHTPDSNAERAKHFEEKYGPPISSMSELAKRLSLGDSKIPARPFLTDGLESGSAEVKTAIDQFYKTLVLNDPNKSKVALWNILAIAISEIKRFVIDGAYRETKPNSEDTKAWKKSDLPLVSTAEMINSLTGAVDGVKE